MAIATGFKESNIYAEKAEYSLQHTKTSLVSSSVSLPPTEPETPQVSYTVSGALWPSLASLPKGTTAIRTALLCAGGKNTSAETRTVNYRILKNGDSVKTGSSSIAAGYYYTYSFWEFYDITEGDVLDCKMWRGEWSGLDYRFKGLAVFLTSVQPFGKACLTRDITYANVALLPLFDTQYALRYYDLSSNYAPMLFADLLSSSSSNLNKDVLCWTVGSHKLGYGDKTIATFLKTSPNVDEFPYYVCDYVPQKLSFRAINLT